MDAANSPVSASSSSSSGSAKVPLYACYAGSSFMAAALGRKTIQSSVAVMTDKGVMARINALAVTNEKVFSAKECTIHRFKAMLWEPPKSSVECCGPGVQLSNDGHVATFNVTRRNEEESKRNRAQGLTRQKVSREDAGQLDVRFASVISCVYMCKCDMAVMFGNLYELRVKEVTVNTFEGITSYEFALAGFAAYGGGNKAPHFSELPGERVPMLLTAFAEAVQHSPRMVPLVLAPGVARPGERESVPTKMLDERCRIMATHDWMLPFMVLPEEAFYGLRRGRDVTMPSPPITSLEAPKWPTREKDTKTNQTKTRNIVEYGLNITQFLARVSVPATPPLTYELQEHQLDEFFVRMPEVSAQVSLWEEALTGYYVLDTRYWYNGTLAAFIMGCPALVRCYVSRRNMLSAWPSAKETIKLTFSACSAKDKDTRNASGTPCSVADNAGVLAMVGVGAVNAGYRVTHHSVVATLKALEKREPRRYNVNMLTTVTSRKRPDGADLPGNPLERYDNAGHANVINVLESNVDVQSPLLASEYEFYVVPNTGPKTSRCETNSATGEVLFVPSEALAWYTDLAQQKGEMAAMERMGGVMEQLANKPRNPPDVECFQFPEDSICQHDFLLFAVRKAWRIAAGLDPLRSDNHKALIAQCYRALYPSAPPAPDSYIAQLLAQYPPRPEITGGVVAQPQAAASNVVNDAAAAAAAAFSSSSDAAASKADADMIAAAHSAYAAAGDAYDDDDAVGMDPSDADVSDAPPVGGASGGGVKRRLEFSAAVANEKRLRNSDNDDVAMASL